MRIAIIGFANDIHVVRWCNGLAERGFPILLVTIHEPNGLHTFHDNVRIEVVSSNHGFLGYLTAISKVKNLIKAFKADVINTHYAGGYGTMARLAKVKPNIVSVYGHDVFEAPFTSFLHKKIIVDNLKAADWIGSTSEVMRKQVQKHLFNTENITLTPFGVDTELFRPIEKLPKSQNDPIIIGTVKKLEKKYGIDILINAFSILFKKGHTNIRLEITGDGSEKANLHALVERLAIGEYVQFFEAISHKQVPNQLNRLDIYVAASRSDGESFGVAVIEASACGLPVVVSDAGGLPEVVVHNTTGLVCKKESPELLSESLETLINNPDKRKQMGANGRERVKRLYSWEMCLDRMITLYQEVLQKHK